MLRGVCYEQPMWEHPISGNDSSWWPTPAAANPNEGEDLEKWLARRECVKTTGVNGNGFGMPLAVAVRLWPTPRASDGTGPGHHGTGGVDLRTAVLWPTPEARDYRPDLKDVAAPGRLLNPSWVECLMGFPLGWTDIAGQPGGESGNTTGSQPGQ